MRSLKNCIPIILFTLIVISDGTFAQTTNTQQDDRLVRSVMAFDESRFNLMFETQTAHAYSNLLIKAFNNMLPLPDFDFSNLPTGDNNKLIILQKAMIDLRYNPPSWEEIVKQEQDKIAAETAPPTAPVFAGTKEAEEYYRTIKNKDGVKHNPNSSSNYYEIKQDQNVLPQEVIEEKKPEYKPH